MTEEKRLTLRERIAEIQARIELATTLDQVKLLNAELKVLSASPTTAIDRVTAIEKLIASHAFATSDAERAQAVKTITACFADLSAIRAEIVKVGYAERGAWLDVRDLTVKVTRGSPMRGVKRNTKNAVGVSFDPSAARTARNAKYYDALQAAKVSTSVMTYKTLGKILFAAGATKVERAHFNENEAALFSCLLVHERDDASGKTAQTVSNGMPAASL